MNQEIRTHASAELIGRYVRGEVMTAEAEWALEVHLENCADCRARIAAPEIAPPEVAATVRAVWGELAPVLASSTPAPARRFRPWLRTWLSPSMVSWIAAALLVAIIATYLGHTVGVPDGGSVLFLLAPVVPVIGVAASWSAVLDPMYELAAASPRAGLVLVLRRTLTVLVLVLPLLVVESLLVNASPALWLLPSLACTLVTLALGSVIGVERATIVVAALWLLAFAPPVVLTGGPPALLGAWNPALWSGVGVLAAVLLVLRGQTFARVDRNFGR